jgi:hypothetical protein
MLLKGLIRQLPIMLVRLIIDGELGKRLSHCVLVIYHTTFAAWAYVNA